jgi:hypothetical protein
MLPFLQVDGEKNPMFKRWKLISDRNGIPDLLGEKKPAIPLEPKEEEPKEEEPKEEEPKE